MNLNENNAMNCWPPNLTGIIRTIDALIVGGGEGRPASVQNLIWRHWWGDAPAPSLPGDSPEVDRLYADEDQVLQAMRSSLEECKRRDLIKPTACGEGLEVTEEGRKAHRRWKRGASPLEALGEHPAYPPQRSTQ